MKSRVEKSIHLHRVTRVVHPLSAGALRGLAVCGRARLQGIAGRPGPALGRKPAPQQARPVFRLARLGRCACGLGNVPGPAAAVAAGRCVVLRCSGLTSLAATNAITIYTCFFILGQRWAPCCAESRPLPAFLLSCPPGSARRAVVDGLLARGWGSSTRNPDACSRH